MADKEKQPAEEKDNGQSSEEQQGTEEQQEPQKSEESSSEESSKEVHVSVPEEDEESGSGSNTTSGEDDTEELPEDVKKKLEKKKQERLKKEKKGKKAAKKKKEKKRVDTGRAYIKATYNNTIVTLADEEGNVISWASAGVAGFKGPKKSTPYAAQIITKIACMKAKEEYGLKEVSVFVRGVGIGRDAAVRALNSNGLNVTALKDITPVPHNGCRPPKPRRV